MRRPVWVTSVIVLELLLGLFFAGICVYFVFLMRSPGMKQAPGAAAAVLGLRIAVGIIAPLALLVMVGAYGMTRRQPWGWWFAFVIDMMVAFIFVYSTFDDGWSSLDWEMMGLTAISIALIVLLLLPQVRRFYRRTGKSETPLASA